VAINRGALPEIVGKGGIVVQGDTPDGFAQALRTVATDTNMREALISNAIQQAKKFSWESFAQSIHGLINSYAH
jgi:alpha-1,3-rhamnosyl/mannosyltransferase